MPGMCMTLCMAPRLELRMQLRLELRLEQNLQLAQQLVMNMEQLTKAEREELARQGLLGSGVPDPLRIRRREVNGEEIVMKKLAQNKTLPNNLIEHLQIELEVWLKVTS